MYVGGVGLYEVRMIDGGLQIRHRGKAGLRFRVFTVSCVLAATFRLFLDILPRTNSVHVRILILLNSSLVDEKRMIAFASKC